MNAHDPQIALITGCTSGIGLHLAHEFAAHGHPLVLVAPSHAELDALQGELEDQYGVICHAIGADLEAAGSATAVFDAVTRQGIQVDILVNNAGHGFNGKAWEMPLEKDLSMIQLNVEAPLRLTKLFLPVMVSRGSGVIFNTASVAGFEAGPGMAVYHASKAFILSWSEALSVELAGTGVSVTALCPGATDTDFFLKAGLENSFAFQQGNLMAPQDVAKAGYQGMLDGELIVIPGVANKLLVQGRRVLTEKAQAKLNSRVYEDVPTEQQTRERGDLESEAAKS